MISEYINIQDRLYMREVYGMKLYFTSEKRALSFDEKLPQTVAQLRTRMLNQYRVDVNCDVLAALKTYMMIELRDFLVVYNGVDYQHPLDLSLVVGLSG